MNAFFSTPPGAARRSVIWNLAMLAGVGLCAAASSASVHAAVTTGSVVGHAPAGATVQVSNPEFGIQRNIPVNAKGRYAATWLPIGVYSVTVVDHGQAVAQHPSVPVLVDRGARVDFSCANGQCSEVAAN